MQGSNHNHKHILVEIEYSVGHIIISGQLLSSVEHDLNYNDINNALILA